MSQKYITEVSKYNKKDAVIAIWFYVIYFLAMIAAGFINRLYGLSMIGSWFNVAVGVACIGVVLIKKEKLSTIGFRNENLIKSLSLGLICGIISIVMLGIVPVLNGSEFSSFSTIANRFIYQLVFIVLTEEIFFRGYLQSRLYGLFRNDISAILICGILFSLMHFPFMFISNGGAGLISLNTFALFAFWFAMHIIINYVYKKSCVIYGVIVFHVVFNTAGGLFIEPNTLLFGIDFSYITNSILPVIIAVILLILGVRSVR